MPAQQLIRNAKRVLNNGEGLDGGAINADTANSILNVLNFTQREVRIAKSQHIDPNTLSVSFFDTSQEFPYDEE